MKTEAVIFDYGNVFVKDEDPGLYKYVAEKISKPVKDVEKVIIEEYKGLFIGKISENLFWKNVLNRLDYKGYFDCSNIYKEVYHSALVPNQEILDVARKIRSKNIKTGILSNLITPLVHICRSNNYFCDFDPIITSAEAGYKKPDKEIYLKIFGLLNLDDNQANKIIYVDDKEEYLVPTRKIGMRTVLFNLTEAKNPQEELENKLIGVGLKI
ncbi:MAG: HAD hydrolase-like protein [Candidatus Aureabacteria bacterium]|nr:HAD hydrolase-like protein [Candidatus Auribacterota bacterium]